MDWSIADPVAVRATEAGKIQFIRQMITEKLVETVDNGFALMSSFSWVCSVCMESIASCVSRQVVFYPKDDQKSNHRG